MITNREADAAWQTVARELVAAPIQFHVADRVLADSAADFKTRFKISLADAFAAALAKEKRGAGDRRPGIQATGKRNRDQLVKRPHNSMSSACKCG